MTAVLRELLILDLDGTVVDSHRYTFEAFRFACAPFRPPPTDAEVFGAFGPPERVILARLVPAHAAAAYDRLQEYYRKHAAAVPMHPAMRPLLLDLRRAGLRLGLFTGRGADSTALLLEALQLADLFDAVVAGDAPGRPKPAPDGLLQLLLTLQARRETALVAGDSPLDVEAARAAGIDAVFAAWHAFGGVVVPPDTPVLQHPDALRPQLGLALPSA